MASTNTRRVVYRAVDETRPGYWVLLGLFALVAAVGGGAAVHMEHNGHWVTGMTNGVVWGLPHVFAVFLIVAASGALNVASISSVFERALYKPLARLSGLLAVALLAGGLAALVLDLGRPDRLIVAMTNINPTSIFSWNILLYTGFFAIVGVYLWTMMSQRMTRYYKPAAYAAFLWRLVLTTGTGSIFGWLVARQGYDAAIMAPLFIALSFAFGKAIFLLVLMSAYGMTGRPLGRVVLTRLQRLAGITLAAALYFVAVQHLTALYAAEHRPYEVWLLAGDSAYTVLFWGGAIVVGGLLPLILMLTPSLGGNRPAIVAGSVLIILGGLAQIATIILGGQAFPLVLFPGLEASSSFGDGAVAAYAPSLPEALLGLGGVAVALLLVTVAVAAFRFLPESLADAVVDPDHVHDVVDEADEVESAAPATPAAAE